VGTNRTVDLLLEEKNDKLRVVQMIPVISSKEKLKSFARAFGKIFRKLDD
jgi:hypothetical protein